MKLLSEMLSLSLLYLVLPPCFIGAQMVGGTSKLVFFVVLFALALITMWGGMLNHYADWNADEINGKRACLHRCCKRSDLWRYQWIPLAALVLTTLGGLRYLPYLQALVGVGAFWAYQYSFGARIKDHLGYNYIYLVIAYGAYPVLLGYSIGDSQAQTTLSLTGAITVAFLFLLDLGTAPSKDYEDVEGDRQARKRTLPTVFGEWWSLQFQLIIFLLAVFLAIVAILLSNPLLWGLLAVICMFAIFILLRRRRDSRSYPDFQHDLALVSFTIRMSLAIAWLIQPL